MDVRLPDGTLVRNIPESTTKAALIAKLQAAGHDVSALTAAPAPQPETPVEAAGAAPTLPEGYHTTGQNLGRMGRVLINAAASPGALLMKGASKLGVPNVPDLNADLNRRLTGLGLPEANDDAIGRAGMDLAQSAPSLAPVSLLPSALMNAGVEAIRSKPGEEAEKGATGLAAAVVPSALVRTLGKAVPTSAGAKELMRRGIIPSWGQAADTSTMRGKLQNWAEGAAEELPMVGMVTRKVRAQPMRQLFDEALDVANPAGQQVSGTPEAMARELLAGNQGRLGNTLDNMRVPIRPAHKTQFDAEVDRLAADNISSRDADRIKMAANNSLWSVPTNGRVSGRKLDEFKSSLHEDGYAGLGENSTHRVKGQLGDEVLNWVNQSGHQQGFDLPQLRQAAANAWALQRAKPQGYGVSGEELMSGVRANDAAVHSRDTATRELRDLAEAASGITKPKQVWGTEVSLTGGKRLLAGTTGALITAPQLSPTIRQLMMGDPAVMAQVIKLLRVPAIAGNVVNSQE